MFIPRKVKYRKQQRGSKVSGVSIRGSKLSYGSFGLKAIESVNVRSRQLEAARRAMTRFIQRGGKVWIRVFPDKAMTTKGAETPMGKGKGVVDYYVTKVQAGRIIFEMDGVSESVAKEAMRLAAYKLPVKTKFVSK